jgi:hypothetical protein
VTRIEIPDGFECDALPSGEYVSLLTHDPSKLITHFGELPTIKNVTPRYPRITKVNGPFRLAGQSSDAMFGALAEWAENAGWAFSPTVPCGVSPVIYDNAGKLYISNCGPGIGSQGYRFCDYVTGALVTGDATNSSSFGVSAWTFLGDGLYVGQNDIERPGVVVWDGVMRREVEAGDSYVIRAQRSGEAVSLAFYKATSSVIIQTTMSELRTLPPPPPPLVPRFTNKMATGVAFPSL